MQRGDNIAGSSTRTLLRTEASADVFQTALVFGAALLLFAPGVTAFEARVTDVSALRILGGDIPYKDFWTMYAPGSFSVLAVAFAVFGRELLISNLMGIATSAAAVALFFKLAKSVAGATVAFLSSVLLAVALFGTGYSDGFTSYPPAILLILAAISSASRGCSQDGWRWAVVPGALLGVAAVFKHDIAGYAAISLAVTLPVARYRARASSIWSPVLAFLGAAAVAPTLTVVVLVSLGAGQDLWSDLVQFPLVDFRHVRGEYFSLVPRLRGSTMAMARELVHWGICNFPLFALVAGVVWLRRRWREVDIGTAFVVMASTVLFWFHWLAAHVQLNTNAISLPVWGLLVAAAGWRVMAGRHRAALAKAGVIVMVAWASCFVGEPAYLAMTRTTGASEWLRLPGLTGVRVPHEQAVWMRELATAMAAEEPSSPLLFLSNRNDVIVYAESIPFWLTARRSATRYHELHPGIIDTEPVQREVRAALDEALPPVVVQEHRFGDNTLDSMRAIFSVHVPVGAELIDEWVSSHYGPGRRFGRYELLRRCPC